MDRVLKLVYDQWSSGIPLANGIHPALVDDLQESSTSNDTDNTQKRINSLMNSDKTKFRGHDNFFRYFKKHYPNNEIIHTTGIKDDNSIYLYPIEIRTNIRTLYQTHSFSLNDKEYKYQFLEVVSPDILKRLKDGKVKLIVNYIHDPMTGDDELVNFESYLNSQGLDGSCCIMVCGNKIDVPNSKITVVSGLLFLREGAERLFEKPFISSLGYLLEYVTESDLDKNVIRPKKFLCFNRQLENRQHRLILAHIALKYGLLENSIFSFVQTVEDSVIYNSMDEWTNYFNDNWLQASRRIAQMLPYEIDTQLLLGSDKTSFQTNNNKKQFYLDTYIHITSETKFKDVNEPFLSEKTFRPMLNLQPFIYVGDYHAIKMLQELGFKTFHPYIDEAYDDEQDYNVRMTMIEKEIKKLNDLSVEELHDLYYNLIDRVIYNRKHLATFINLNPYENLIRELQNGI